MNALEFKNWLEERDASCSIMVKSGQAHCAIFPFGAKPGHEECAESPDLGEAIRLAQHLYDIRHQGFPCPECGSPVRWIRATRTPEFLATPIRALWRVAGIKTNGLACCETDKRRFLEEREARDVAREAEIRARITNGVYLESSHTIPSTIEP